MVSIRISPVDAPDAHALLEEYFALRASIFPGGGYRTVFPSPATFVEPAGVFVVLDDDEGRPAGCGGIRRIDDGPHGPRDEVKHLFVRSTGRGRGWGRAILDDLERRARERGAAELVLDTHHTLDAAGGLYARSGFQAIPAYNDNANATRWYGKVLG
ncbi:MAG: PadR family transcriptional regulator [Microbacterium sp. 71-36]|mgnify:CR=1 FL=1|uniref:GNAT family N-acetyltransferase n=1 Tax=unclassified Microbacterium TaxID=2609290 RepID=UPI000868A0EC|nr:MULTISPECIES: GNAT family N-acetyltransferase [unclassified Microbacterium]MBN9211396.1 GNAT family N-acetyltransferase [Microbacterium sp.]ODT36327.1 MAG: PadR family transcriptional regulator [Microbacterium sp. SCN 71-17]OJV74299.1 MAG: PadR family transcriptional regulator [Microbacterium sp. 71-36]